MKKSILFVAFVVLISGLGYAKDNTQTEKREKSFLKGFELALLNQRQTAAQAESGKLVRYQEKITQQLKIQHPHATKIFNLGKLPTSFRAGKNQNKSAQSHYLWEVKEGDLVSFFYDVQISPVLRATSGVIPSHVSSIAISIKEIKAEELVEKLRSLKK